MFLYLSAVLLPFTHDLEHKQPTVRHIILNSLKLSNNTADFCLGLLKYHNEIIDMCHNPNSTRKEIGLLIRKISILNPTRYDLCIFVALIIDCTRSGYTNIEDISKLAQLYEEFIQKIDKLGLQNCHLLQPLLNGKEICKILGIKPGPSIGVFLQQLIEHQLENPDLSVESAIKYIKKEN